MEQTRHWPLLDEIGEAVPITGQAAQRVRANAPAGCLICVMEEADAEWDDE